MWWDITLWKNAHETWQTDYLCDSSTPRCCQTGLCHAWKSGQCHSLYTTFGNVESALTGSKSGNALVTSRVVFDDAADKLYPFIVEHCFEDVDIVVISCPSFGGSFEHHLAISNMLKLQLSKVGYSLSLQARQGAASEDPKAALFEVVVGYVPEKNGAMLLCLPEAGVVGALNNVRGLLKHGLNIARGKAHNHHHTLKH